MSIFGGTKPRVEKKEFRFVKQSLRGRGNRFTDEQIEKIEHVFHGSMSEKSIHKGIDPQELKRGIDYIKKNKSSMGLSDDKIKKLEGELRKRL